MFNKKLNSGFEMPVLGIGTFGIGGKHKPDFTKDKENIAAIKSALKLGYTNIDTAEVYGGGHTEELVGEAIEGYDRSILFITTKVFHTNLRYEDVIKSCKASIKRMKIAYIDLYLVHSSNPDIPIDETMRALNELVEKRLVKNIGVCNFSIGELKEAQKHSKNNIVVNQMKYSLWTKNPPDIETMEYCQKNDIMVAAYKLFGRGKINTEKIKLLENLAKKYKKTEAQIMINWVVSKKNFIAIFKSMNKNHLKDNLEAMEFKMNSKDHDKLNLLIHDKV